MQATDMRKRHRCAGIEGDWTAHPRQRSRLPCASGLNLIRITVIELPGRAALSCSAVCQRRSCSISSRTYR